LELGDTVTQVSRWVALGAPLDCSGTSRGEEAAPAALRRAGVLASLGIEDRGDAHAVIEDSEPDASSGLVAHRQVLAALGTVREHVAEVLAEGGRPLVLGGDCSVALGALAAGREQVGAIGLAWVDGHIDGHTLATAPNAELADIVLSVLTGHDPPRPGWAGRRCRPDRRARRRDRARLPHSEQRRRV
jgi:arginase